MADAVPPRRPLGASFTQPFGAWSGAHSRRALTRLHASVARVGVASTPEIAQAICAAVNARGVPLPGKGSEDG